VAEWPIPGTESRILWVSVTANRRVWQQGVGHILLR
jgi:hypothetical protein